MTTTPPPPTILHVAVPSPLYGLFDYLPPAIPAILVPGVRVYVPFGARNIVGMIVNISHSSSLPLEKLKMVHAVLDTEPLFPEPLWRTLLWASDYYHCPLGIVLETGLPVYLRQQSTNILHAESHNALDPRTQPAPKQQKASHKQQVGTAACLPTEVLAKAASSNFVGGGEKQLVGTDPLAECSLLLNPAQLQAVNAIHRALGKFRPFCLDGVTGSGKTEVYLQAIAETLKQGQQALVLVPEIGLTPQMVTRFEARFKVPIAVLHSLLTPKKRWLAWLMAKNGEAPIVIGTRSAAFVPLKHPGLFIIDEEHDLSFKQQEGFRYSARDLLILRASLEGCPIVLGSATPALETLHNISQGRYQKLSLPNRAGTAQLPTIQILDIRHKKLHEGLSAQLLATMQTHLDNQAQVLLFLNRRGFAPVLMCFDCGWIAHCPKCDAKLTFHYRRNRLCCHHCEGTSPVPIGCPDCKNTRALQPLGIGTERLERALAQQFPKHTIVRLDRDNTQKKGALKAALQSVHENQAHILIGTQMIAKGHHFPNVTLVAIVDMDSALFSLDFRSTEHMGQLLLQVAGRAGRAERLGEVLLQTCHPTHPLLTLLLKEGYPAFANTLLTERRATGLPPYSHQILLRASAKRAESAMVFLEDLKKNMRGTNTHSLLHLLGPVPAPMEKRGGHYRAQLLLQSTHRSLLKQTAKQLMTAISAHPLVRQVHWSLDTDPLDMF